MITDFSVRHSTNLWGVTLLLHQDVGIVGYKTAELKTGPTKLEYIIINPKRLE